MNIRTNTIQHMLGRWLERYSPPRSMVENEQAQADEVEALLRVLLKYAPSADYEGWVNAALDRCAYQMKTRAWPTMGELGAVCSNMKKEGVGFKVGEVAEPKDMAQMTADRMNKGEAIGEGWIYGVAACELAQRGLVDRETMTRYRSAAFFQRREMYGEEAAKAWEVDALERHEAGKKIWKSRDEARKARVVQFPIMRARNQPMEESA